VTHEVSFERAGATEVPRLMQQLERGLARQGYSVSARSNGQLQLVSAPPAPHRLIARIDATRCHFTFAPGAPGVTLPDQLELERRIDLALGGAVAAEPRPSGGAARRCSICATVVPAGATECPLCGMPSSP
jgi:hypothetical protein